MKSFLFPLVVLFAIFVPGCKCDCPTGEVNSIYFAFNIGTSPNSFTTEEVDTVMLYELTKNTSIKLDSVMVTKKSFTLSETGVYFGGGAFWEFDYLIKTQANREILISDFEIASGEDNTKCKCYVNLTKRVKVANVQFDLSGKTGTENSISITK